MGMLLHHTWLNQQEQKKPEKAEAKPVEEVKEEKSAEETPVKRVGGRRKTTK